MKCKISALIMDVDGTLTDGGIYIGNAGEVMKRFSVKDGYGIRELLPRHDIIPVVFTARESQIVKNRCEELEIKYLIQNCRNKVEALNNLCGKLRITPMNVAYIGDDMNDYEVMTRVGIRGCPANAVKSIKEIADFISCRKGGEGAVREFIEWIIQS